MTKTIGNSWISMDVFPRDGMKIMSLLCIVNEPSLKLERP